MSHEESKGGDYEEPVRLIHIPHRGTY